MNKKAVLAYNAYFQMVNLIMGQRNILLQSVFPTLAHSYSNKTRVGTLKPN